MGYVKINSRNQVVLVTPFFQEGLVKIDSEQYEQIQGLFDNNDIFIKGGEIVSIKKPKSETEENILSDKQRIAQLEQAILELSMRRL